MAACPCGCFFVSESMFFAPRLHGPLCVAHFVLLFFGTGLVSAWFTCLSRAPPSFYIFLLFSPFSPPAFGWRLRLSCQTFPFWAVWAPSVINTDCGGVPLLLFSSWPINQHGKSDCPLLMIYAKSPTSPLTLQILPTFSTVPPF